MPSRSRGGGGVMDHEMLLARIVNLAECTVVTHNDGRIAQRRSPAQRGFGISTVLANLVRGSLDVGDMKLAAAIRAWTGLRVLARAFMLAVIPEELPAIPFLPLRLYGQENPTYFAIYFASYFTANTIVSFI